MTQELVKHLGLNEINIARWNTKLRDFEIMLDGILKALPIPDNPTREEITELRKFKQDSIEALKENDDEIKKLNQLITKLEMLKDRQEVLEVKKNFLNESDQYTYELDQLRSILLKNRSIVNYAIFKSLTGEPISSKYGSDPQVFFSEVNEAVEEKLLVEEDLDIHTYRLNEDDRLIKKSLLQIEKFQKYLRTLSPEALESLSDDYEFDLDTTNRKFWTDVLKLSFYGY